MFEIFFPIFFLAAIFNRCSLHQARGCSDVRQRVRERERKRIEREREREETEREKETGRERERELLRERQEHGSGTLRGADRIGRPWCRWRAGSACGVRGCLLSLLGGAPRKRQDQIISSNRSWAYGGEIFYAPLASKICPHRKPTTT